MNTKPISRRTFLKASGAVIVAGAAVAAAGCAGPVSGTPTSNRPVAEPEVAKPTYHYGKPEGQPRILVTYATRTGSTVGVAAAIGEELGKRGFSVDVSPVSENPALEGYAAVLMGSAINGGQWLPEALAYVEQHREALQEKVLAVFCVHIMNLGDDEKSRANRLAYLDKVRALVHPVDEAYFAGLGMKPEDEPAIIRWVYRTFKIGPEGDCRDWEQIRGWAETLEM